MDDFYSIYCTIIHIAPFDFLLFYIFRDRLRWSIPSTLAGYLILLGLESIWQINSSEIYNLNISLLCQVMYLIYDLYAIKDYPLKVLALGLLTVPLTLISYNAANYIACIFPNDVYLSGCTAILLFYLICLPFILKYINKHITPFISIKSKKVWLYICLYQLILLGIALSIDPLCNTTNLISLVSRLLLLMSTYYCVLLTSYICSNIKKQTSASLRLEDAHELYELEKANHALIMQDWFRYQRIRHDLKHHLLTLKTMLHNKEYDKMYHYLSKAHLISVPPANSEKAACQEEISHE